MRGSDGSGEHLDFPSRILIALVALDVNTGADSIIRIIEDVKSPYPSLY